jgi:hypothetical protein
MQMNVQDTLSTATTSTLKKELQNSSKSVEMFKTVNGENTCFFIFKGNTQAGEYNPDADGGPAAYEFYDIYAIESIP